MRRAGCLAAAALAAWLAALAPPAAAQDPTPLPHPHYPAAARPQAVRLSADAPTLRIDGQLDEAVWSTAPAHEAFVQFLPLDRQAPPPGYRTSVQIVIEPQALVFGLRAWVNHVLAQYH